VCYQLSLCSALVSSYVRLYLAVLRQCSFRIDKKARRMLQFFSCNVRCLIDCSSLQMDFVDSKLAGNELRSSAISFSCAANVTISRG
jgi:hypothetical protein